MKTVIAFIEPFMAEKVVEALHQIDGLSGATFSNVRGFGRGRSRSRPLAEEDLIGTVPKVRVEAMISDDLEDRVVRAIQHAARTGRKGDGKVYVASLDRAIRIRTEEEGEAAV